MESERIVMTSTFYPPYHLGGDAVHVRYLSEELARRGHEVHVVHSMDAFALKAKGREVKPIGSEVHVHPVRTSLGAASAQLTYITGRSRAADRELRKVMHEARPAWVHHHNISLLGQGMLSAADAPEMFTSHDHWPACPRSDLSYLGRTTCERSRCTYCSLRTARPPQLWRGSGFRNRLAAIDRIISPSEYMARFLKDRAGLASVVLPNFVPPPGDVAAREAAPHFVFVGVLEKHKGLDLLLEGYEKCGVEAELHILGSGSLEGQLREAEKRTGGRVRGLGFLSRKEVLEEVGSAIALMAPSVCQENSPLSCIEALSVGTPLIVSPNGGLPDLVASGCGLVVETTPGSIGEGMRRLEKGPDLRARLSTQAQERYKDVHHPNRYLASYLELGRGLH
ncbi:MAG: glycosyltransferase family 4 protein [Methanomassiliicoccus sp.]|nr:glycosyltransferase family 4 protein [Methanomassiliicoccus sp.]